MYVKVCVTRKFRHFKPQSSKRPPTNGTLMFRWQKSICDSPLIQHIYKDNPPDFQSTSHNDIVRLEIM